MTFSEYGAVFGNMDAYGDVIANGAFAKTIADFKTSGGWPDETLSSRCYRWRGTG